ncbi:ABC transporter permease [Streptomyces sp. NPDC020965]|uniref:ABC transporter permease n=1 Tax=Streptomyces sp. NPDC020965 TaxID=3365105 RepID=UPI0037B17EB0
MSTSYKVSTPPAPRPGPTAPLTGIRALARAEARRLLRHPALLVALALCIGLWGYETVVSGASDFPVLHDQDRYLQLQLLLVAAGVFLAVHLAVLRPARDGTDAWFRTLVLEPWQRAAAHLLAVLPAVALVAVLAGARTVWLALLPGAVGTPSAAELAAGPAVVLLAGALAVLIGTLSTSVAAGPITLGVLGIATVVGGMFVFSPWRWWGLIAVEDGHRSGLPSELLGRPAALHLLYLLLLAAAFGAVALLRTGLRGPAVRITTALAVAGALATGAAQLLPVPDSVTEARDRAVNAPSADQRCVRKERITYCAFPEFLDRHREWSRVVDGILRRVPAAAQREHYVVRQRIAPLPSSGGIFNGTLPKESWADDDRRAGTPGAIVVGTGWGNGDDSATDDTSGFATSFALRVVRGGAAGGRPAADRPGTELVCGGPGIVSFWLAAQAAPETAPALRSMLKRSWGDVGFGGTLAMARVERGDAETAMKLLDLPAAEVRAKVAGSWTELTDPATTSTRAAQLLGVSAPAVPPAVPGEEAVQCPR